MEQNGAFSGSVQTTAKPATLRGVLGGPVGAETLSQFFKLTGGSPLFCLSAVFVAYGIVKVLGPILAESAGLRQAMPCLLTLHAYEAALLGALLLIVFRNVVDDALSLAVLIGLFLVSTSIALGAVGGRGSGTLWMGLAGIAAGGIKLGLLCRYAKIPFGRWSLVGVMVLLAANYLGPLFLGRILDARPGDIPGHRALWFWVCLVFLAGAAAALIEAVRGRDGVDDAPVRRAPFLRQPAMGYLFVLIVLAASGIHLYTLAYSYALTRAMGDFVPLVAMGCLLLMEVFRHAGKRSVVVEILLSFTPLAMMLFAIHEKSAPATGQLGPGLIAYPPVLLAVFGVTLAVLGVLRGRLWLFAAAYVYGLGVLLTAGYSPLDPHALHYAVSVLLLGSTVFLAGILLFKPYVCLSVAIGAVCAALYWKGFPAAVQSWGVTHAGGLAGIWGVGVMAVVLIFGRDLYPFLRVSGAACLALFVFDWLPASFSWRYAAALGFLVLVSLGVWYRTRDILLVSVLLAPLMGRVYMAVRFLAYWRMVIVGFILLAGGTVLSLFKRKQEVATDPLSAVQPASEHETSCGQ